MSYQIFIFEVFRAFIMFFSITRSIKVHFLCLFIHFTWLEKEYHHNQNRFLFYDVLKKIYEYDFCSLVAGNVTLEATEITNQTLIANDKLVRILIISFGTLVTITLLLFIGREILRFYRLSKMHNNPSPDDVTVAYNNNEDVIEPQ